MTHYKSHLSNSLHLAVHHPPITHPNSILPGEVKSFYSIAMMNVYLQIAGKPTYSAVKTRIMRLKPASCGYYLHHVGTTCIMWVLPASCGYYLYHTGTTRIMQVIPVSTNVRVAGIAGLGKNRGYPQEKSHYPSLGWIIGLNTK